MDNKINDIQMKIYLIRPKTLIIRCEYFDSAVVVAPDIETARRMHPDDGRIMTGGPQDDPFNEWCPPEQVEVQLIGVAINGIGQGVICSSFNVEG